MGLVSSLARYGEMALELFAPEYPAQLKQRMLPQLPTNGELLVLGAPLATWIPRSARTPRTKARDFALGASMYVLPQLVKEVGCRLAESQSVGHSGRLPSPYVTETEFLPFQTDPGY